MERIEASQNIQKQVAPALTAPYISTSDLLRQSGFSAIEFPQALVLISRELGVSPAVARRIFFKLTTGGNISNLQNLKQIIGAEDLRQSKASPRVQEKPIKAENTPSPNSSANVYHALTGQKDKSNDFFVSNKPTTNKPSEESTKHKDISLRILSNLVSSPKVFASWLVNNRAAFILLKDSPQATYILSAISNPNIALSPLMLAEISKLIAQLMKLKLGKTTSIDDDEDIDIRKQKALGEELGHKLSVVGEVHNVIGSLPVSPLKDFLLEAERFAEEEIANRWSITLKKEKQLEHKLLSKLEKLRQQREQSPNE